MEEPVDSLIEVREELMVSPNVHGDGDPILRKAHFLKPTVSSLDYGFPELNSNCLADPSNFPLKVNFEGWRIPQKKWEVWVDKMKSRHGCIWKKAGIYEAILSSTYIIKRNDGFVFGVAERWCPETNTFIFPWGETTITLEDLMVLMGFSVLGDPVFSPLETTELKEIEAKLIQARTGIVRSKARKACQHLWIKKFEESEGEFFHGFEHEAFLALWLSRFVFPNTSDTIRQCVFPIAIHLARGTTIALAPAVLADIYMNLSKLKRKIDGLSELDTGEGKDKDISTIILRSPFQLVQIWAWERFSEFRPCPNSIIGDEPRAAQWHNMKIVRAQNVRFSLDRAGESFQWRLCANIVNNSCFPKLYGELDMWVSVDEHLDKELKSFTRCLRTSELVGLDCIEQYLPHRVARQFGIDQDLPGSVVRFNETPRIAWKNYSKPMINMKLYIPSRSFKAEVTTRYFEWWKESMVVCKSVRKRGIECQRSLTSFNGKKVGNEAYVPRDISSKRSRAEAADSIEQYNHRLAEMLKSVQKCDKHPSVPVAENEGIKDVQEPMHRNKIVILSDATTGGSETSQRGSMDGGDDSSVELIYFSGCSKGKERDNDAPVHPLNPSKYNNEAESVNQEEDEIAEILRCRKKHDNSGVIQGCDGLHSSSHTLNLLSAIVDKETVTKPVEKVMHSEVEMGGSPFVARNAKVNDAEIPVRNLESMKGNEAVGSMSSNEKRLVKLVARISRLERLVAQEKALRPPLNIHLNSSLFSVQDNDSSPTSNYRNFDMETGRSC